MLYKVSKPNHEMLFFPKKFWRSDDWRSSSTKPKAGYIPEEVLYAGDFDEVGIHLLPGVMRIRIGLSDEQILKLSSTTLQCDFSKKAAIYTEKGNQAIVEAFRPTVFTFSKQGFECVPSGEFVARKPQKAISCKTYTISEALEHWNIGLVFVDDLDVVLREIQAWNISYTQQD